MEDNKECRILNFLSDGKAHSPLAIAQGIGYRNKRDVNQELYSLSRKNQVVQTKQQPPEWALVDLDVDMDDNSPEGSLTSADIPSSMENGKGPETDLENEILTFLGDKDIPYTTPQIVQKLDHQKGEINPALYKLANKKLVKKCSDTPPTWTIGGATPATEQVNGTSQERAASNGLRLESPSGNRRTKTRSSGATAANDLDRYKMDARPLGRAVIINNNKFNNPKKNRKGSDVDARSLEILFDSLGFTVTTWTNKTAQEIYTIVWDESQLKDHRSADAFILVVLSHGDQGVIKGIDDESVNIKDGLITPFSGNFCSALRGKPKIFLIQACQGGKKTTGYRPGTDSDDCSDDDDDTGDESIPDLSMPEVPLASIKEDLIHEMADVFVAYATYEGYRARRNSALGSWFIEMFVATVKKMRDTEHLADIVTEVRRQVHDNKSDDTFRQICESRTTLRKKLYFYPKNIQ